MPVLVLVGSLVAVVAGGLLISICFAKGHRILGGVSVALAVSPVGWGAALGWLAWAGSTRFYYYGDTASSALFAGLFTVLVLLPGAVGAALPARPESKWAQRRLRYQILIQEPDRQERNY